MRYPGAFAMIAATLLVAVPAKADMRVCNDFRTRIHLALAYQDQRSIPASGWWVIEPGVCEKVEFAFKGATIYYAADSDDYKDGASNSRDHWGNKVDLFVTNTKFDFDDAQGPRDGAAAKKFSIYEIPPQHLGKPAEIVFHFVQGKTNISITTHNN